MVPWSSKRRQLVLIAFVLGCSCICSFEIRSNNSSANEDSERVTTPSDDDTSDESAYFRRLKETIRKMDGNKEKHNHHVKTWEHSYWWRATENPPVIFHNEWLNQRTTFPPLPDFNFNIPTIDYKGIFDDINKNSYDSNSNSYDSNRNSYDLNINSNSANEFSGTYHTSSSLRGKTYIIVIGIALTFKMILICCYYGRRRRQALYIRTVDVLITSSNHDRVPIIHNAEEVAQGLPTNPNDPTNCFAASDKVYDMPPPYSQVSTAPPSYEEASDHQVVESTYLAPTSTVVGGTSVAPTHQQGSELQRS